MTPGRPALLFDLSSNLQRKNELKLLGQCGRRDVEDRELRFSLAQLCKTFFVYFAKTIKNRQHRQNGKQHLLSIMLKNCAQNICLREKSVKTTAAKHRSKHQTNTRTCSTKLQKQLNREQLKRVIATEFALVST